MVEWIHLYDSETGEVESSWIRAIGWRDGAVLLRRYEEDIDDIHVYKYEPVPRRIFEQIRSQYQSDRSVGSAVNELLVNNKDIPQAEKANL